MGRELAMLRVEAPATADPEEWQWARNTGREPRSLRRDTGPRAKTPVRLINSLAIALCGVCAGPRELARVRLEERKLIALTICESSARAGHHVVATHAISHKMEA